jgi:hypothetical protein
VFVGVLKAEMIKGVIGSYVVSTAGGWTVTPSVFLDSVVASGSSVFYSIVVKDSEARPNPIL